MSELSKIIKGRRSVRNFRSDPVPKELIEQITEVGAWSASGKNMQSARIIAVTNRELRDRIAEENRKIGGWQEGFDPFYNAPVIIIVIADKSVSTAVYDGSIAIANMMLKAHELGLGNIWIHRAKQEFEGELGKEILSKLGIEGEFEGIGHIALGYTDQTPVAPERKENRVFFIE